MTPATAAAPLRLGLGLLLPALLAALVLTPARAAGAGSVSSGYLAPAPACARAGDPAAPAAIQRRSIACLLNRARSHDGLRRLAPSRPLERAAALKGRRMVSCGQFSHTPCNSDPIGTLRTTGYRYSSFGENFFVGPWGGVSARDVVAAWLDSPTHRANVLHAEFRELGAALVRAPGPAGGRGMAVWVVDLASPR